MSYESYDPAEEVERFALADLSGRQVRLTPYNALAKLYANPRYDHILYLNEDGVDGSIIELTDELWQDWQTFNLPVEEPAQLDESAYAFYMHYRIKPSPQDYRTDPNRPFRLVLPSSRAIRYRDSSSTIYGRSWRQRRP